MAKLECLFRLARIMAKQAWSGTASPVAVGQGEAGLEWLGLTSRVVSGLASAWQARCVIERLVEVRRGRQRKPRYGRSRTA